MRINKVKGTYDVMPEESKKWQFLETKIKEIMKEYNYLEIRTPIMEYSPVFHRENELSDMVTKETYNFKDKADRDLTLRPEGTAGVIRSYVENKVYANNDIFKVFYIGQQFRYERPQKGRYRQFMQFGVEAVGTKSAALDAEVIAMAANLVKSLGLKEVVVEVNSLGDVESRNNYRKALVDYFTPYIEQLSNDSKERLKTNPLRILDSKSDSDILLIKDAPKPLEFLTKESALYFTELQDFLKAFNVNYVLNDTLVRGLDYYGDTVFEVKANIKGFGAQNVLGGGGRYESLVKELGGPDLGGIGMAFGMDRLLLALEAEALIDNELEPIDAYIITFGETEKRYAASILSELRINKYSADMTYNKKSFKAQLRYALKLQAKILIIIGEDELNNNVVSFKNTTTEIQTTIKKSEIVTMMKKELGY